MWYSQQHVQDAQDYIARIRLVAVVLFEQEPSTGLDCRCATLSTEKSIAHASCTGIKDQVVSHSYQKPLCDQITCAEGLSINSQYLCALTCTLKSFVASCEMLVRHQKTIILHNVQCTLFRSMLYRFPLSRSMKRVCQVLHTMNTSSLSRFQKIPAHHITFMQQHACTLA